MNQIKQIGIKFITSGFADRYDSEPLRKIILMNVVCMTGIVFLIPMGVLAFVQKNVALGCFDLIVAGILIFNLVYLRITGNYNLISYIGMVTAMTLFAYLLVTGGVNNTAYVWYYTFPLFAMFLLGITKGTIASIIMLVVAIAFFIIEPPGNFFTTYPFDLKMRFIPSFMVVLAYSFLFEFVRGRAHGQLTDKNRELAQTVKELKDVRLSLENARHTLEVKVEKRTADLKKINIDLKNEVEQRRLAQQEVNASNERFITVLNSIEANVFVADCQTFEILFVNRNMAETFGNNMVGQKCWQAVRGQKDVCTDCPNNRLFDDNGQSAGLIVWEYYNLITNRWYHNYDRAIRWTDGRWVKIQVAVDVTDRKRSEKTMAKLNADLERKVAERTYEISQANRELRNEIRERENAEKELQIAKLMAERSSQTKSEFLANMSHELRTPLNHIIGFTELIIDKHFGDLTAAQEEYLTDVVSSSHHLLSLINDILDISKIEAKKMVLTQSSIDIRNLIAASATMVKEKALKHRIELSVIVDPHLPHAIDADERRLKQILYNLLSNAVKFTPDGGNITIQAQMINSLSSPPSETLAMLNETGYYFPNVVIFVSVSDTGIGIDYPDLNRIFLPFEQVESSANRKFTGTGLGLSLTKEMVELHGGRIGVKSQGKDKGATFWFTLPMKNPLGS